MWCPHGCVAVFVWCHRGCVANPWRFSLAYTSVCVCSPVRPVCVCVCVCSPVRPVCVWGHEGVTGLLCCVTADGVGRWGTVKPDSAPRLWNNGEGNHPDQQEGQEQRKLRPSGLKYGNQSSVWSTGFRSSHGVGLRWWIFINNQDGRHRCVTCLVALMGFGFIRLCPEVFWSLPFNEGGGSRLVCIWEMVSQRQAE